MQHKDFTTRLQLRHAIVQGPFGGSLSTARLAACVSDHRSSLSGAMQIV